ncbi:MAG: hypothetical protein HYR85_14265 [Planctomycetes bacterium]|nr:hypothetical protein [Planctomycetota bacterium]MBI3846561.1 hypothetical protein [Planctomycetota bacterium]
MTHLASYLKVAGINARKSDDSIAILIPKRHIETWILCLAGETVDEATDYKRTRGEQELASKIGSAAETLFAWTRPKARVPRACVPSLQVALPELARLE